MKLSSPLTDYAINLREMSMKESAPLSAIHQAVIEFLRGRNDVIIFGAHAVNSYVDTPRMTQGVDLLSTCGKQLADELCSHLHQQFQIAVRVRTVAGGVGFRVYQIRTPKNRHLVDVRQVDVLPEYNEIDRVNIIQPAELIAMKVMSAVARSDTPKGLTDEADLLRLCLAFPELKSSQGKVVDALDRLDADEKSLQFWQRLAVRKIQPEDDDQY